MLSIGQLTHYFLVLKKQVANIIGDLFFFVFFRIYFGLFLFLNICLWIASFYIKKVLDEPIIALHYNVDFGVDYYGSSNNIYILPVLGLVVFLFNAILFSIVRNQQDRRLIGQILCSVAVLVNLILLIGMASIYIINLK